MNRDLLGIDVGSTSIKIVHCNSTTHQFSAQVLPHDGNVPQTVLQVLDQLDVNLTVPPLAVVTGTEARFRIQLPEIIAPVAIERGLIEINAGANVVVCMGGEDLVVYSLDSNGQIISTYAGNKCACGTGEFFRQQLGRMNLDLDDIAETGTGVKGVKRARKIWRPR